MEHIERLYILNRINITRFNSTNATLLICLHKLFRRLYMDYPYTALTTLNESQRHSIEIIQTRFFTIQEEQLVLPAFLTMKLILVVIS